MKIASQLLNISPSANATAPPATDNGIDFHGVLATTSNKIVGSNGNIQAGGKSQGAENKKKDAGSSSSVVDTAPSILPDPGLQIQDIAIQLVGPLSPDISGNLSHGLPSITGDAAQVGIEENGSLLSSAPLSSALQVSTTLAGTQTGYAKGKAKDTNFASAQGSLLEAGVVDSLQQDRSSSMSIQSSSVRPAVTATAAALVSVPSTTKTSAVEPTNVSTVAEGNSSPTVNRIDSSVLATQQAVAAAVQSVSAPALLPTLYSGREMHSSSSIATKEAPAPNSVSGISKEGSLRQIASVSKSKAGAVSAEARDKATDSSDGDAQADSASAVGASFVNIPEAAGTAHHTAGDSGAAFNPAIVLQDSSSNGPSHSAPSVQSATAAVGTTVQTFAGQASSDGPATQGVTSAQLSQSMRSSEMKLGMSSAEFGNISISTSLNHQAISAQISIDHSALSKALAVHLPAIEEKLGSAYGVQAKVELRESNNPSSSNNEGYSNSGQQSRDQRHTERGETAAIHGAVLQQAANRSSLIATSVTTAGSRLDIRI